MRSSRNGEFSIRYQRRKAQLITEPIPEHHDREDAVNVVRQAEKRHVKNKAARKVRRGNRKGN